MPIKTLSLPALAAGLLLLAGCDGGSSSGSDSPLDDGSATGSLVGNVTGFFDSTPLAGVQVTLRASGSDADLDNAVSDADGAYRFDAVSANQVYELDYSAASYRAETYASIRLDGDTERDLEPVRLISLDNAGSGSLTGSIVNAVDGQPIAGASLTFRVGINARDGDIVATATADADGTYTVADLPYGNLTCVIVVDGFQTVYTTVQVLGNVNRDDQNVAVSPRVARGDTRIVLTWGEQPRDLDSHLTGPGADGSEPFHIYFIDQTTDGAVLDRDDTQSFGPETITVDASRDGVYRYSVLRFSAGSDADLSNSDARVQVIEADGVVADFFVPRGAGDLWTVFDLIGGEILPVNTITESQSEDDFFAPETRPTR